MAKETRELTAEELADITGGCSSYAVAAERVRIAYRVGYRNALAHDDHEPWKAGRTQAMLELNMLDSERLAELRGDATCFAPTSTANAPETYEAGPDAAPEAGVDGGMPPPPPPPQF